MLPNDPLMPKRHTGFWFSLDANRINAQQKDPLMNQLEQWDKDGVIDLFFSETAASEVQRGRGAKERIKKVKQYFQSQTLGSTPYEKELLCNITNVLFGRMPNNANEWNDVEIVFNAKKYPGSLITEDGNSKRKSKGILAKRDKLKALGIEVRSTSEAIELIRRRISMRDRRIREICDRTGAKLPEWIGQD